MDLHDFAGEKMYFDEEVDTEVSSLLDDASENYSQGTSEFPLLKAHFLAPQSLTVVVALYRYYYYQHCYNDALSAANTALTLVSRKLQFNVPWQKLNMELLGFGVMQSMTLVRFYLLCLKGAGYLNLRLGNREEGVAFLEKVSELDSEDRLGAAILLRTVEGYHRQVDANFGKLTVVSSS